MYTYITTNMEHGGLMCRPRIHLEIPRKDGLNIYGEHCLVPDYDHPLVVKVEWDRCHEPGPSPAPDMDFPSTDLDDIPF
jgi:hypothetical protein